MSLAGRILTVIVTLMFLVSIWLSAQVAQLNRNWGSRIAALQKTENPKLAADLSALEVAAFGSTEKLLAARAATDYELRLLRQDVEDTETRLSQDQETMVRAELLLEAEKSINGSTQAARERRLTEKADYLKSLADTHEELKRLAAENDRLIARANELRDRFQQVLADNQQLLERAKSRPLPAFSQAQPVLVR
jgi:hypothetical protein